MIKFIKVIISVLAALSVSACAGSNSDSAPPYTYDTSEPLDTDTYEPGTDTGTLPDTETETAIVDTEKTADIKVKSVAKWKGSATAAYSIVHDDICDWSTMGVETNWVELNKRHLVAGFGVIVSSCNQREKEGDKLYDFLKLLKSAGNQIINHTYTHPSGDNWDGLTSPGMDIEHEINDANNDIETEIKSPVDYFVFPLDAYNDTLLTFLKDNGFLSARGGTRNIDSAGFDTSDPLAAFKANFDCFNENRDPDGTEENCSIYPSNALQQYLDDIIDAGGCGIRELHNIGDSGWGHVSLQQYAAHLDYVAEKVKSGVLWMDTALNVMKYRASRALCGDAVATDGVITFENSDNADCQKYSTELTVLFTAADGSKLLGVQGNRKLTIIDNGGGQFMVNVNPAGDPAYIVSED